MVVKLVDPHAILKKAEDTKGQPLSEDDVQRIRDQAPAMVVPHEVILKMNEIRDYFSKHESTSVLEEP